MNWNIEEIIRDPHTEAYELEYIVDRMEKRQERIEQMQIMILALLTYMFLLIV